MRGEPKTVIFGATPLLRTATPSRARHTRVRIAWSTQQETIQPSPSDSAFAHTACRKIASKPPPQPPHGESKKSPLRCDNVTDVGALGHSMEHVDVVRHARAVEPQPRDAIHLQPPSVAGGLQTCANG